MVVSNL